MCWFLVSFSVFYGGYGGRGFVGIIGLEIRDFFVGNLCLCGLMKIKRMEGSFVGFFLVYFEG